MVADDDDGAERSVHENLFYARVMSTPQYNVILAKLNTDPDLAKKECNNSSECN